MHIRRIPLSRAGSRPRSCGRLLLCCLLLAACSAPPTWRQPVAGPRLQWPPAPAPARLEWLGQVRNFEDAGITKGFWRKFADFLAGGKDEAIGRPYGIYADDQERLFIADPGRGVVHLMDRGKNRYAMISAAGGKPFRMPIAVTGDDRENLYITDSAAGTVYRYRLGDGSVAAFARLQRPTGIAFNRQNRLLYVTDTLAHQIVAFDLAGQERLRLGGRGEGEGELNYPTDLFIDAAGKIYVTDPLNARVQVFSMQGEFLQSLGGAIGSPGGFYRPKGVAVDSGGHIYVCDALLDAVDLFAASGAPVLDIGGRGGKAGEFWMPSGIFIDGQDTLYVADTYNRRVQVFRIVGKGLEARGERGPPRPSGAPPL